MLDRIAAIEREHAEIEARLGDPDLASDNKRYVEIMRRYSELGEIASVGAQLRSAHETLDVAKMLYAEAESDEREELRTEISGAEASIEELEQAIRLLLLPKDPNDGRNVIVEIRGAEGGEEANLFARDLFEMYKSYAQSQK